MSGYIGIPNNDNRTLLSATVTTTGVGPVLDMTGYDTALIQVNQTSGQVYRGIITFERSLDNVVWYPCLVTEMNAMNQKTQIDSLGIYAVRSEAQYLRYNVTNISGSFDIIIDGGQSVVSPVDKVAWAMDETNNSPLNVKLQTQNSGIKQDLSGAFILSDAPSATGTTPQTIQLSTGSQTVIDTQGYQTIHLTTNATFASTSGVQFSNDGVIFSSVTFLNVASGVAVGSLAASSQYSIPVFGRYAKIAATTGGAFTYYLRNIPSQQVAQNLNAIAGVAVSAATAQLGMNIVQVGGTAAVTGGLAGTLAVGGSTAAGVVPTTNPIIAGAIDPGGLGRRLFSDAAGRLIINPYSLGVQVPSSLAGITLTTTAGGNIAPVVTSGFNNQVAVSIQETSEFEGQSQVELLSQILQELKILNQQIYELPRILAGQLNGITAPGYIPIQTYGDEPTAMRNDASLFAQQQ